MVLLKSMDKRKQVLLGVGIVLVIGLVVSALIISSRDSSDESAPADQSTEAGEPEVIASGLGHFFELEDYGITFTGFGCQPFDMAIEADKIAVAGNEQIVANVKDNLDDYRLCEITYNLVNSTGQAIPLTCPGEEIRTFSVFTLVDSDRTTYPATKSNLDTTCQEGLEFATGTSRIYSRLFIVNKQQTSELVAVDFFVGHSGLQRVNLNIR